MPRIRRRPQREPQTPALYLALAATTLVCLSAGPLALAQVFKCVDGAGRTTYQQAPCGPRQTGSKLETENDAAAAEKGIDAETRWRTTAARHEVIAGMPKRWVQQALGQPSDIRSGVAAVNASEVWSYSRADGVTRVGFNGGVVAWSRLDPAAGADGGDADPFAESNLAIGRDCGSLLSVLPTPVSQEPIEVSAAIVGAEDRPVNGIRYTFEGASTRVSFTCAMGKLADVQRQPLR